MNRNYRVVLLVLSIICLLGLCTACGIASIDATFTTAEAIASGIGIVLASIAALLAPGESVAIQAAVTMVTNALAALKTLVDDFEADKTGTGTVADINAGVAAVKAALSQLVAAANIKNPTLQAWITNVVNLIGNVVSEVETDILPNVAEAKLAYAAGDKSKAEALSDRFKAIQAKLKADNDSLLDNSGLPADAIAAAHKHIDHAVARHLGPIRI